MTELTQERLREVIDYSPILGLFWHIKARRGVKVGSVAGSKHSHGYVCIRIDGRRYYAHRLAWLYVHGQFPPDDIEIDHENNIKYDNRLSNLRLATRSQNEANSRKRADNTSSYKGVVWHKRNRKWRAQIHKDRKCCFLGHFDDPAEAAKAYDEAAIKQYGDFAYLNFPKE